MDGRARGHELRQEPQGSAPDFLALDLTRMAGSLLSCGVGSLSLLQQIFLTQESNWGLLHCQVPGGPYPFP